MAEYCVREVAGIPGSFLVIGGVKWTTLLGSDLEKQSLAEAKRAKATHYVMAGAVSSAVGTIKLPVEKDGKNARRFYSAAAIFAAGHATGAFVTKVRIDDLYWVVAVHEGLIAKSTDVLCTSDEADELILAFKSRHQRVEKVTKMGDVSEFLNINTQLIAPQSAWESIPHSAKIALVALGVLAAANYGWGEWSEYQAREEKAKRIEQVVDARAEWTKALDQWAKSVELDGPDGLSDVYREVTKNVPWTVGGWELASGRCDNSNKVWLCSATYTQGAFASNKTFVASLPAGWKAGWNELTNAVGSWSVPAKRVPLKRDDLAESSTLSVDYVSSLQDVLKAFRKVELTVPAAVSITEPKFVKYTGEVAKVAYPSTNNKGLEIPKIQTITLAGPLRSIAVMPVTQMTKIKSLRFVVEGRGVRPDLRASVLNAELVGEIYVK
jgi:hypothetical protein